MIGPSNILVSFSNFKGSLTNEEACNAACEVLRQRELKATSLPLGDGGRGTFSFLKADPTIQVRAHSIIGAFGDPRTAHSWWRINQRATTQIFLESTDAIGYPPQNPEKRDPLGATSRGLGEWLLLIERDLNGMPCELFIGLGDSAISDAGYGILELLEGKTFPSWKITVLCDVDNPLCGENGSARIFAPQKGASPEEVFLIEARHLEFAGKIWRRFGKDVRSMPRGGSAGGLATALHVFLGAELVSGAEFVLEASQFMDQLKHHDYLIVGEGRSDSQTLNGKAPWAAIQRAEKLKKKSLLISGSLGEGIEKISASGLIAKIACGREPTPKAALMHALENWIIQKCFVSTDP